MEPDPYLATSQILSNAQAILTGPNVYRATPIGDDGRYEMRGLAAGQYVLEIKSGQLETRRRERITVPDSGCVAVSSALEHPRGVGRIRGQALGVDGRPRRAAIEIEPVEPQGRWSVVLTEKDGTFESERLPAGRYRIGLELGYNRQPVEAYGKTYYPGTPSAAAATPVEISAAAAEPDIQFVLPGERPRVDIRGVVLREDGQPAQGIDVRSSPAPGRSTAQVWADKEGGFQFATFGSVDYRIEAQSGDGLWGASVLLAAADLEKPITLRLKRK